MNENKAKPELSTEPYKGVRDFYPEDQAVQNYIFGVMRKTVESFGYSEYNASILEPTELYTAKTSEEIVNEQTFSFKDRGDREVTLRPEMTPTVARMVAGKRKELSFPIRWYSIPNVFRYEQPQKGRMREHWQLNVDLFGINSNDADTEIISIAHKILKNFGAKDSDFIIKINSRKLTEQINANFFDLSSEQSLKLRRLVDRKSKISYEEFADKVNTIFQHNHKAELFIKSLNFEKGSYLRWISENALSPESNPLIYESYKEASELLSRAKELGISNIEFDPEIQRGFDYYTGVVFEVFDTNPENRRSLFGGGRFDNLTANFGGEPIPAIGFGMGDVTARDFLESRNLLPKYKSQTELFIATIGPIMGEAQLFAQKLRDLGLNVSLNITSKKIGDQIKMADRLSIPFVLVLGEDELKNNNFKVKELSSGTETECGNAEDVVRAIKE